MNVGKAMRNMAVACMATIVLLGAARPLFAAEPAVVTLWNYNVHDKKYQQKMYKLFNQRNPDIRIDYSSISNTVYNQTLEAAFIAKQPPDLFLPSDKLTFNYLKDKGLIQPLNDIAPGDKEFRDWMARYPSYLRSFVEGLSMFNGKVYHVNLQGQSGEPGYPLFYNKTIYKDAGIANPPATQSEMRKIAAKITQAGAGKYFGFVHGLRWNGTWSLDSYYSLAVSAGLVGMFGKLGSGPDYRDGKNHFGDPKFKDIMKLWIGMRKDGSVYPGETTMDDEQAKMSFATNRAGMEFGAGWSPGNYLAYNPDADFDLVVPPTPDDGINKGRVAILGVGEAWGYFVSSATRYPRAAWKVIDFLCSAEYQTGYVQGGFGISFLPEANKRENYNVPQMYKFVEWANDPKLRVMIPFAFLSQDAKKVLDYRPGLYPSEPDVLTNIYMEKSPLEALDDLDKRLDAQFDAAIAKAQEAGLKMSKEDFIFPDWDPLKDYVPKNK